MLISASVWFIHELEEEPGKGGRGVAMSSGFTARKVPKLLEQKKNAFINLQFHLWLDC